MVSRCTTLRTKDHMLSVYSELRLDLKDYISNFFRVLLHLISISTRSTSVKVLLFLMLTHTIERSSWI